MRPSPPGRQNTRSRNPVIISSLSSRNPTGSRPRTFIVHFTKVCVNALGLEEGWDKPVGLETEIIPKTRPYGLWTGNVFTGQVLIKGKPAADVDVETALHDAAQFYWGDAQAFRDGLETFAPHSVPVVLPRWMVMDIDTPEDWEHAELLYRALRLTREEGAK